MYFLSIWDGKTTKKIQYVYDNERNGRTHEIQWVGFPQGIFHPVGVRDLIKALLAHAKSSFFYEADKRLTASEQIQPCSGWISAPTCPLARSPCIQSIPLAKTTEIPFNESFSLLGKWFQNVEQGLMQVSWKPKSQQEKKFTIWKNIVLPPKLTLTNDYLPPKCYPFFFFLEC